MRKRSLNPVLPDLFFDFCLPRIPYVPFIVVLDTAFRLTYFAFIRLFSATIYFKPR